MINSNWLAWMLFVLGIYTVKEWVEDSVGADSQTVVKGMKELLEANNEN